MEETVKSRIQRCIPITDYYKAGFAPKAARAIKKSSVWRHRAFNMSSVANDLFVHTERVAIC